MARPGRLVPLCLLAACAVDGEILDPEDFGEETADPVVQLDEGVVRAVPLRSDRSVLVTEPRAMEAIQAERPLGLLLGAVGRAAITKWAPAAGQDSADGPGQVDRWVERPFRLAAEELAEHDALPTRRRIGLRDNGNPYRRVLEQWPSLRAGKVGDGPFRLLAVVNRMDLAGDFDARGIAEAAREPRSFGEMRLVFGYVDRDFEKANGRPYPMTFIIEYRLPAIDASYDVIEGYDHRARLFDDAAWRTQMERWGLLWRSLSAWDPSGAGAAAYRDQLDRIVRRVARPENFVALRANARLSRDGKEEFDLREWYVLRADQWMLIRRKPRDEPYRCGDGGADLERLVRHYWDAARGDLDMSRLTPGNARVVSGFNLPRNVGGSPVPMAKVRGIL